MPIRVQILVYVLIRWFININKRVQGYTNLGTGETFEETDPVLSPDWYYNLRLQIEPLVGLNWSSTLQGVSKSFLEPSNNPDLVLPAYGIFNTSLSYSFKGALISLEVNNVLDKFYFTNGAPLDIMLDENTTIAMPGYHIGANRNFFLSTKFSF